MKMLRIFLYRLLFSIETAAQMIVDAHRVPRQGGSGD